MKWRPSILVLLLAAGPIAGAVAPAPTAAESAAVRERIDALLKRRLTPSPLPVDPPNPFVVLNAPGVVAAETPGAGPGKSVAPEAAPLLDADDDPISGAAALARYASRLRIAGLIRIKDQVHIIINDSAWREGDLLIVERNPRLVQLQVARIQPGQLTLRLGDAELVMRF
jgi:hypothetical protein